MSKTVIEMAREAGVYSGANERVFAPSLERFAALVAAQEREAIAKELDEWAAGAQFTEERCAAESCAEVIRARKETR